MISARVLKPLLKEIIFLMERDPENWKEMEIVALAYLVMNGYTAQRSITLKGVRGKHKVDVFGEAYKDDMIFKVIVECKYWNQKVKKQQVATLASIMEDIGVSKGIIISRIGFQIGAIRYAAQRPIELLHLNKILFQIQCKIIDLLAALFSEELQEFKAELHATEECSLEKIRNHLRGIQLFIEQSVRERFGRYKESVYALENAYNDLLFSKISGLKIKAAKGEQSDMPKKLFKELSSLQNQLNSLKEGYRKIDYVC
jgi:hypothetical protein